MFKYQPHHDPMGSKVVFWWSVSFLFKFQNNGMRKLKKIILLILAVLFHRSGLRGHQILRSHPPSPPFINPCAVTWETASTSKNRREGNLYALCFILVCGLLCRSLSVRCERWRCFSQPLVYSDEFLSARSSSIRKPLPVLTAAIALILRYTLMELTAAYSALLKVLFIPLLERWPLLRHNHVK
jgi:hypothetical protein